MQTSDGGGGDGINREEYIAKVAQDIQDKLPDEFDIFEDLTFSDPTKTGFEWLFGSVVTMAFCHLNDIGNLSAFESLNGSSSTCF